MPFSPRVSIKQAAIINDKKMYPLVTGPRNSSKSRGVLHSIAHRMWNIDNYVGCMIGCSAAQNAISGLWTTLTENIMRDWVEGRMYDNSGRIIGYMPFGMEWIVEPKMEALTHRLMFSCTNKFGNESRYYLDSLKVESEVWERYRGKTMADIYLTEADNFKQRATFDCLVECLRDYPTGERRLVCDTNPPAKPSQHWLYDLFFWFREIDLGNLNDEQKAELNLSSLTDEAQYASAVQGLKELQSELSVHTLSVADNCFISEKDKRAQFARYAHNKDLLDRMFWGLWVETGGEGFFKEVLRPEIHFRGDAPTPLNPEPDILLPDENCIEIGVGFDIGSSRNSSISFIETVLIDAPEGEHALGGVIPHFRILDEIVEVNTSQDINRICDSLLEKAEFWEGILGRKLIFDCWSDSSSFSPNILSETSESKEIFRLTGGKFNLKSVADWKMGANIKGHGGVRRGLDLVYRLLFQDRLVVSRAKCPKHVEMLTDLKPNRDGKLDSGCREKHVFDSARYFLSSKCWLEMQMSFKHKTKNESPRVLVTSL